MAEEVKVGSLVFEQDEDLEGNLTVTVHKIMDLEGWITFTQCPESEIEWANLRNNCYPFNGRSGSPPRDTWIVYEYVGKESSSANLNPDKSNIGFTDDEIHALVKVVNLMFGESSRLRQEAKAKLTRIITH